MRPASALNPFLGKCPFTDCSTRELWTSFRTCYLSLRATSLLVARPCAPPLTVSQRRLFARRVETGDTPRYGVASLHTPCPQAPCAGLSFLKQCHPILCALWRLCSLPSISPQGLPWAYTGISLSSGLRGGDNFETRLLLLLRLPLLLAANGDTSYFIREFR